MHEIAFIPHTTAFVTAGVEHLKYWKINEVTEKAMSDALMMTSTLPALKPQSANREHVKDKHFVSVVTVGKATYALTYEAVLCKFSNKNGNMTKYINLHS